MKTTTKVVLAVSLSMIVLGTGLSVAAWAASGGNIGVTWGHQNGFFRTPHFADRDAVGISRNIERESVALDAFQSISVTSDYGNVKLIPSDDYRVEYALFADLPPVEISVENGLLRVDNTPDVLGGFSVIRQGPWWDFFRQFDDELYIYVYYPRSATLADATIENGLGKLTAEALTLTGGLDVRANLGEIGLEDIAASRVTLRADMGSVKLDGLTAKSLTTELAMGSLEAENCVVGSTSIDANMGSIELEGDFSGDVDIDCAMGSVELKTSRPRAEYRLNLSAKLGGATVDGARYRAEDAGSPDAAHTITVDCNMGSVDMWFGG